MSGTSRFITPTDRRSRARPLSSSMEGRWGVVGRLSRPCRAGQHGCEKRSRVVNRCIYQKGASQWCIPEAWWGKRPLLLHLHLKLKCLGCSLVTAPPNHQHREAHTGPEVLVLGDAAPALWLASCLMASFISWLHPEAKRGESSVEGPLRGSDVFNVPLFWPLCATAHSGQRRRGMVEHVSEFSGYFLVTSQNVHTEIRQWKLEQKETPMVAAFSNLKNLYMLIYIFKCFASKSLWVRGDDMMIINTNMWIYSAFMFKPIVALS